MFARSSVAETVSGDCPVREKRINRSALRATLKANGARGARVRVASVSIGPGGTIRSQSTCIDVVVAGTIVVNSAG
jgi:hypothetical protein